MQSLCLLVSLESSYQGAPPYKPWPELFLGGGGGYKPAPCVVQPCLPGSISQVQEGAATAAKSLQSCPTLCDPIDGSPPGSPVPGILQARTLEWVAISSSKA